MSVNRLHELLDEYQETPASFQHEFCLSLGDFILRELHGKGWTQRELASEARMNESQVSLILSGSQNWTAKTAGRLLHALGVRAHVRRASMSHQVAADSSGMSSPGWRFLHSTGEIVDLVDTEARTHDSSKKISIEATKTPAANIRRAAC